MLNQEVKKAIETACEENGQSDELATLIISWLEQLVVGNEIVTSQGDAWPRLKAIYEATVVKGDFDV